MCTDKSHVVRCQLLTSETANAITFSELWPDTDLLTHQNVIWDRKDAFTAGHNCAHTSHNLLHNSWTGKNVTIKVVNMPQKSVTIPQNTTLWKNVVHPNLMSWTPLLKGSDVTTDVGLLLTHGNNSGQMPFLLPPNDSYGYRGNWTQARWAHVRHLND